MKPVTIDVWSDIACPWCWVGQRNLAKASRRSAHEVVTRRHAFELNPDAPREAPEPVDYVARLARKYGTTPADAQAMIDRMVEAGRAAGVEMRFDRVRPSNTFDAHRLMSWADDFEARDRLEERLFTAYLHEGRVMADPATLVELAADVDLDGDEAAAVLASDRYADAVRHDEQRAASQGIRGVPAFVIDQRFLVTGAQPPDVLVQALDRALAERS